MTEVRLRVRTVSEIVDAAFALYRRDSGQYILFMAFAITPQVIAQIVLQPGTKAGLTAAMIGLVSLLVSGFTFTMGSAAIMKYGAAVYLGEEADVEATLRSVIPKVGRILWAGFLKLILYFIGFLVFFVGEFYVAARFFGVTAAIVLEDARTAQAFARSTELSNGRKRHVLNTLLLVWIIYVLLSGCILFATMAAKSQVLTLVLGSAYQIVAYPIFGLATMLLYYDCRIRGEGFDIEQMAASLGVAPGSGHGIAGAAL
jgi:hypothetical protein